MYLINSICIDVLFVFKIIFSGLIKNKDHTIDFYFSFFNIDIQKYKNNLKLKYFFRIRFFQIQQCTTCGLRILLSFEFCRKKYFLNGAIL